jgi:hypothetical protein
MWKALLQMLTAMWRRSQTSSAEESQARQRERFWNELHEGEREAESRTRP